MPPTSTWYDTWGQFRDASHPKKVLEPPARSMSPRMQNAGGKGCSARSRVAERCPVSCPLSPYRKPERKSFSLRIGALGHHAPQYRRRAPPANPIGPTRDEWGLMWLERTPTLRSRHDLIGNEAIDDRLLCSAPTHLSLCQKTGLPVSRRRAELSMSSRFPAGLDLSPSSFQSAD